MSHNGTGKIGRGSDWKWMRGPTAAAVGSVALGALSVGVVVALVFALGSDPAARRVCDAVVHTLLTTRDPLELRRADMLARDVRCDVARRAVRFLQNPTATQPH